jgi:hypothetical protein
MDEFSDEICEALKAYIYRLEDPRSGRTFYVGKGRANRAFAHVRLAIEGDHTCAFVWFPSPYRGCRQSSRLRIDSTWTLTLALNSVSMIDRSKMSITLLLSPN